VATGLLDRFFSVDGFGLPPGGLAPQVRRYVELDGHAVFVARVDGQQAHDLLAFYTRLGFADRGLRLIEMPWPEPQKGARSPDRWLRLRRPDGRRP
jgi:hypothetical protein